MGGKKENPNYYRRKQENEVDKNVCNHDEDHWCTNCIKEPEHVDLRNKSLGQGFVIGLSPNHTLTEQLEKIK